LQGDGAMKEWTLFERTIGKIEKLNIPNTPKFLDKGKTDSTIWYEYSYIEGESLRDLIGGQTLRVSRRNFITDIIKQLLVIQDSLIKNGIIHRDIKPSNVIIDNNNVVHLIDFNTIKTDNKGSGTTSILSWGYTPIREILLCNDKTDIYSIGVIWYEMLTNTDVVELAMKNKPLDLDKIEDDNIRNIISNMITDDYDKRWDTKKILYAIENPQVTQKVKSKPNYVLIGGLIIFIGSLII
jgi:serine/threonine protein kinase